MPGLQAALAWLRLSDNLIAFSLSTRDVVEGLRNFREFSQSSSCLDEAM